MDLRAVIFVPALAGSVICGFIFLMFAANYYLTVMESTGVGAKEVTWFSEPILDNAWKLGYLAWLIGLWLGPAYFIGRAATSGMDSVWWKLAVPIAFFWLCYPISQLSSLSGNSIWYPLVPDVFARLAQRPIVTFGFLLLSIPILAAFAVGFKWAFLTEDAWRLLFAGAPLMVIAGLMYARLIGRLAFALKFTKSLFSEKRKKKPTQAVAANAEEKTEEVFSQPSELPPINTPYDGELSGYDVKLEDDPLPRPKKRLKAEVVESEPERDEKSHSSNHPEFNAERKPRRRPPRSGEIERSRIWTEEDEDSTPYHVREAEGMAIERDEKEKVEKIEKHRVEEELKLLSRDDVPKKPKVIWGPELFAFFAQSGTISAIMIASGLCFLAGTMVRVARMFNPAAGAGPD